ncbi:MAG: hypothetical protein R3C14_42530 [Caldilineaceae bacterium]
MNIRIYDRTKRQRIGITITALLTFVLLAAACPAPVAPQVTPPEEPTKYEYTLEKFPNGKAITGNTGIAQNSPRPPYKGLQSLEGNEFSEWGFLVGPNSNPSCAVIWIGYLESNLNYLTVEDRQSCPPNILEISFTDSVKQVTLDFTGASVGYVLAAFDDNDNQISESNVRAEFEEEGNLFPISVESDDTNIKRVTFIPNENQIIAVNKITYWR